MTHSPAVADPMPDLLTQLSGPLGGVLASTWGVGAVAGYLFAQFTIGKRVNELEKASRDERDECNRQLERQSDRITELEHIVLDERFGEIRKAMQAAISEREPRKGL